MNVSLSQDLQDYVTEKVRSGAYADEGDVLSEALRFLKEYEAMKRAALRAAVQEGLDSGPAEPFDFDVFMDEVRRADPPDAKP